MDTDTDVEVLKAYDDALLQFLAFNEYEGCKIAPPATGTMASEANRKWITEQLAYYDTVRFLKPDGLFDLTSNTGTISRKMRENFVEANLKACLAPHSAAGQVFNIAYGGREYLIDILHSLTNSLGCDIEPVFGPEREGYIKHSNTDITKARIDGIRTESVEKCSIW